MQEKEAEYNKLKKTYQKCKDELDVSQEDRVMILTSMAEKDLLIDDLKGMTNCELLMFTSREPTPRGFRFLIRMSKVYRIYFYFRDYVFIMNGVRHRFCIYHFFMCCSQV